MAIYLAFIRGGHGFNTAGKRTPPIKSLGGRQIREHEFNEPAANFLIDSLKRNGVKVFDVSPGDRDAPLRESTDMANKIYWQHCREFGERHVVAVYVSMHFNAFDGSFEGKDPSGFSVHIHPGSAEGRKLANKIIEELKNGTQQINRGVVEQNLHETRETAMTAALVENGFMDNAREALLMLNADFQKECAEEVSKGICAYMGIKFYPEKPQGSPQRTKGLYKVQVGAFASKANAERLQGQLKEKGFANSFITQQGKLFKVQLGAFSNKANAASLQKKVEAAGFKTFVKFE